MAFKVQVGPPQISIHQGQTVLITEQDGQINWPSEKGLYFLDTRIVSSWAVYANGEPWDLLNGGAISYYASRIFLTNRSLLTEDGAIPPRALGLTISRSISGGMHEDLDVTNNSMNPVKFQLEVALRCDFADIFEVKSGRIVRRGRIATQWSEHRQQLRTTYRNADFSRSVTISPGRSPTTAVYANGRLSFEVALEPGAAWHCCLLYALARRRQTFFVANRLHRPQPQVAARRDDGGLAEKRGQNPDQQRGILSPVSPGARGHGRPSPADRGHRSHGLSARRRAPLVHRTVWPRQPDRLAAKHPDLSRVCAWRIGDSRLSSGEGRGRLPRCRAGQNTARNPLRRTCAFQADPAHAVLRYCGCDAALLGDLACRLARDRRPGRSWSATSRPPRDACPGSTIMATATATDSRNIRPDLRSATRTWAGRIPATASSIPTARWSKDQRRSASCKATSMMPGHGWPRCLTRSASRIARRRCARKPARCSTASTKPSGTKSSASTPMRSTAIKRRC